MGAVVNNLDGALVRGFAAQVGYAVLGRDRLQGVLAVVYITDQRHDGADPASLGGGRAGEGGKTSVAREIAAAADAIHELAAHHVGAVDVAKAFGAIVRFTAGPSVKLNPRNFRSCGRAIALFASLTLSLSFCVMNRVTLSITR